MWHDVAPYLVTISSRSVRVPIWEAIRRWYSWTLSSWRICRMRNPRSFLGEAGADSEPFSLCTVHPKSPISFSILFTAVANSISMPDAAYSTRWSRIRSWTSERRDSNSVNCLERRLISSGAFFNLRRILYRVLELSTTSAASVAKLAAKPTKATEADMGSIVLEHSRWELYTTTICLGPNHSERCD